jgi:hypothetical protein
MTDPNAKGKVVKPSAILKSAISKSYNSAELLRGITKEEARGLRNTYNADKRLHHHKMLDDVRAQLLTDTNGYFTQVPWFQRSDPNAIRFPLRKASEWKPEEKQGGVLSTLTKEAIANLGYERDSVPRLEKAAFYAHYTLSDFAGRNVLRNYVGPKRPIAPSPTIEKSSKRRRPGLPTAIDDRGREYESFLKNRKQAYYEVNAPSFLRKQNTRVYTGELVKQPTREAHIKAHKAMVALGAGQRAELKMTESVKSRLRTIESFLHRYHSTEAGEQVYSILMKYDEVNKEFVDETSEQWPTAKYVPLEGSVANSVLEMMATRPGIKGGFDFQHRDKNIRGHRPTAPYMKSDPTGQGMKAQSQTLYNSQYAIS